MKLRVHIGQSDRKRRSPAWWPQRSDGCPMLAGRGCSLAERFPDVVGPSVHLRSPISNTSLLAAVSAALAGDAEPPPSPEPPEA